MKTLIKNGVLLLPDQAIECGWICIHDGKIEAIGGGDKAPDQNDCECLDVEGRYISPGLIDIHVHGGGGHDFMDGTIEAVVGAAVAHLQYGTTAMFPTSLTCPDEELMELFASYRGAKQVLSYGPELLGIHLEGPYLSQDMAGAQDVDYLRMPDREHYMKILDIGGADIARLSVAIELPGAMELGDEIKSRGILGSIGHTNATIDEVELGLAHGYTHLTHWYSTMSTIRREKGQRVLGVIESPYLLDDLTVEIIADGMHLPAKLLQLIYKNIHPKRICLITDAMRGAGMPNNCKSMLGSLRRRREVVLRDGVAYLPDFSAFAGSVCTADRCVRTFHQLTGAPLWQSVAMMSYNPAYVMGVSDRMGALLPGLDANILIADQEFRVEEVFFHGQRVRFEKNAST